MDERILKIGMLQGGGSGWGGSLALRSDYPEKIVVDLSDVNFVVPLFMIRLRTFIDWHMARQRIVKVIPPDDLSVRNYLARMHVGKDLPPGCFELPTVNETDRSEALVPVTRVTKLLEVDALAEMLMPILVGLCRHWGHPTGGKYGYF